MSYCYYYYYCGVVAEAVIGGGVEAGYGVVDEDVDAGETIGEDVMANESRYCEEDVTYCRYISKSVVIIKLICGITIELLYSIGAVVVLIVVSCN